MRTRIFLTPYDTLLAGRIADEHEHIHIICDSADAGFTVTLPDAKSAEHREFIFYNRPSSGSGNDITISPMASQFIWLSATSYTLTAGSSISLTSDMKSAWVY